MKTTIVVVLAGLMCLGSACTVLVSKETRYLKAAKDHATQEQVHTRLGEPKYTATTEDGKPIWVYQVMWVDTGVNNQWGTPGAWCDEYVLTFDKQGILRDWTHKSEGHGGETMPEYCVKDGFESPT
ncbi:MAG: hypothetical protein P0111_11515 [Nitrospira sp.]|nr:hypothetical protein [Nitrospira sp.]